MIIRRYADRGSLSLYHLRYGNPVLLNKSILLWKDMVVISKLRNREKLKLIDYLGIEKGSKYICVKDSRFV